MLSIKWRPSGGRGEYEFKATGVEVLGKRIDVLIPELNVAIRTDAHFQIKDGKPRLRREAPNDRNILNVPPLVSALSALPEPRREDTGEEVGFPLSEKSYVVEEVLFEIVESDNEKVLVKPILLKPRNCSNFIDVESRISDLVSIAPSKQAVSNFLDIIRQESNIAKSLTSAASAAHDAHPYFGETSPIQTPEQIAVIDDADEIIQDYVGTEGKEKIRIHRHKERDRKLVRLAKKKFRLTYGKLFCECCGIDFEESYSTLGIGFIEAHHKIPLSDLGEENKTSIDDLAMLCANCHRMVHRTSECSIDEVRQLIIKNNSFVNAANVALLISPPE